MTIAGSCHCGNIRFEFDRAPGSPATIAARACDCSFCVKHGGLWTSSKGGALRVMVADASLVSRYAFGTHTAQFHVCTRCGIVPFVTSEIDGRLYGVVSVNAFNGVDPSTVTRAPASFDGEDEPARLARRKRNWIDDVRIGPG